jgi:rhodanese-related sulfurtransferase
MAIVGRMKAAAVGAAMVVFVAGCGGGSDGVAAVETAHVTTSTSAGPRLIGADEFAAAIAETDTVTINVHVPFEGDIAGTDMSIPFDQVEAQASQLPANPSTPLAVYCRTGRMSALAVSKLAELGYTNIVELQGGMQAWEAAGRPLIGR